MTQEDRQLLLQDLCARLPYGVQCEIGGRRYGPYTFVGDDVEDLISGRMFKPYLRPMSSMTEKELNELEDVASLSLYDSRDSEVLSGKTITNGADIDWLNEHHFDYRGLIEKGLALEAPEGMYNLKNK